MVLLNWLILLMWGCGLELWRESRLELGCGNIKLLGSSRNLVYHRREIKGGDDTTDDRRLFPLCIGTDKAVSDSGPAISTWCFRILPPLRQWPIFQAVDSFDIPDIQEETLWPC